MYLKAQTEEVRRGAPTWGKNKEPSKQDGKRGSSFAWAPLTSGPQKGLFEGAYMLSEGMTPFACTLLSI